MPRGAKPRVSDVVPNTQRRRMRIRFYIYLYLFGCVHRRDFLSVPTLVGATAAVHHDDDCPIRGQLVKSGVVAKLSPRVLPAQIVLKSTTNHSKYMKTVKQVNEHIAFQSIFETA